MTTSNIYEHTGATAPTPAPPGRVGARRTTAIIVDLDGTLALRGQRNPHKYDTCINDLPNTPILQLVQMVDTHVHVLLVSGRPEDVRAETVHWLHKHGVRYWRLFMRPSKDNRKDAIIKEEIYRTHIEPYYAVMFVLDDRAQVVQMWRRIGLTCLQVADGDF